MTIVYLITVTQIIAVNDRATMFKGQITSEYLLISVVSIALIAISLTATFKIKDDADKSYELLQFKNSVDNIYNAAENVCALGNGNSRKVEIDSPFSASTDSSSGYVIFVSKSKKFTKEERIVKNFTCKLDGEYSLDENIIVKNNNGKIEVITDG
ncbi:MAG: hypothetical protein Q7S22_01500 [Candidatus Micrarchaeota archaeon]|nr:hypothetical protein [Candidatus Micrarchaeota archaeon]